MSSSPSPPSSPTVGVTWRLHDEEEVDRVAVRPLVRSGLVLLGHHDGTAAKGNGSDDRGVGGVIRVQFSGSDLDHDNR